VSDPARRTLITGLTGQDGSLLARALLADGHEVHGVVRGGASAPLKPAEPLRGRVEVHAGDLWAPDGLAALVGELAPDELYHLAAPSFVPQSWDDPAATLAAVVVATAALLGAVRDRSPHTRLLVAGSAQMFGDAPHSPQTELTPCRPRSPYAVAKLASHQLVGQFRAREGIFACSAILYNHESELRPENFVVRKITRGAAAIKLGQTDRLVLGDTSAVRDWSYAGDIVAGCRLILGHDHAEDYVLASGTGHTVQEVVQTAFAHVGVDPANHVEIDGGLVRTPEQTPSVGDATRARTELGWKPQLSFEQLIARMVDFDLRELAAAA
jgi:GDPmannose 4,6-dehydratase